MPPPPPPPSGPNMSGHMERMMANCPSAVRGAVTQTARTTDGIDVTVTAPDATAEREIITRAEFHARTPKPLSPIPHIGLRGGGSHIGYCPLLHDGTSITTTPTPGGITMHIQTRSPERVRELQEIVEARAARMRNFPSS